MVSCFQEKKSFKGMCYFGDAKGPKPSTDIIEPDLGLEYDLMAFYADEISHPNLKRTIIADYLESLGGDYDARIINRGEADTGIHTHPELIIPLEKYEEHVSKFEYNYNVSGFTMSIPGRFIDSFMVGTAVVTDNLKCKWYKEFSDDEVIETINMGYEKMEDVDWNEFYDKVNNLPKSKPERIKEEYKKKWEPSVVAQYIIDTVLQ